MKYFKAGLLNGFNIRPPLFNQGGSLYLYSANLLAREYA